AEAVLEPLLRDALEERHLAALEPGLDLLARARALTLDAGSARLALARSGTAADPLPAMARARARRELVQHLTGSPTPRRCGARGRPCREGPACPRPRRRGGCGADRGRARSRAGAGRIRSRSSPAGP